MHASELACLDAPRHTATPERRARVRARPASAPRCCRKPADAIAAECCSSSAAAAPLPLHAPSTCSTADVPAPTCKHRCLHEGACLPTYLPVSQYAHAALPPARLHAVPCPSSAKATTLAYQKRFFLSNSVVEYEPGRIMITALFVATKVGCAGAGMGMGTGTGMAMRAAVAMRAPGLCQLGVP